MKGGFLLITAMSILQAAWGQSAPEWENPEIFAVNKEATRATALPYPSEALAARDQYAASPYYQSLDGLWQFYWTAKVADLPREFYLEKNYHPITTGPWKKGQPNLTTGHSDWTLMPVPGNWEFNGYGIPMYINTGFGFPRNPPFINRDDSPTGAYRRLFEIPKDWDGRKIFLHFEGGTNSMYVWVNGQKVGYTENAKSPAEFDISPYIRVGKNLLACEVHKFSDGTYLEDQDMWRLGGINRSVYLYSTATTRIQDFFSHADLDADYKNGRFSTDVKIRHYGKAPKPVSVSVTLLDRTGKKVFHQSKSLQVTADHTDSLWFEGLVVSPLKWTAETPHLYNMLITLKDDKQQVIEATSHKIGFRKIEIKDGQVLINGKKIMFKGVNLHEFNTLTGQVVDSIVMLRNIRLFKELNINAVRTSHYPQQPLWYKLCDEYGIYLVDETNLESHGLGYGPDNVSNFPEWQAAHLDRVQRLIERDKNHASVIFWSLGNEASNGKAFFTMYDWAKARDKSRPVQYEQAHNDRNTDILCPMYPSWTSMQRDAKRDLGRPFIMCEYAHAMGNSMGNFQDYWDLMRSSKNMQGGFIWEWYNHGFKTRDEQGRSYWAYGGDLNGYNKPNDGNFCMDGIISPDQRYLPHTHIVKKVYQNILFEARDADKGMITVINDFKFTAIKPEDYDFKWVLLKNGDTAGRGSFEVSLAADSRKDIKLKLPPIEQKAGTEYFLHLYAYTARSSRFLPAGFESAKGEIALGAHRYFEVGAATAGNIEKKEDGDKLTFKANGATYEFYKNGRGLSSINGNIGWIFRKHPQLNFWRAPTDNDFGSGEQYRLRIWEAASHNQQTRFVNMLEQDGRVTLNYQVTFPGLDARVDISYTVNTDGSLTITPHYKAGATPLPEMMRFGMNMELSERFSHFTWYGRGPWENYVDRHQDAFMAIWEGSVEDQAFPYYRPQEAGNKTDLRWMTLTDKEGKGIRITGAQPLSASATSFRTEDWDPGTTKKQQHASDILPSGNVIVNVDLFQRGLAGLNSWGARPLDQYRFQGKEYSYSFTISLIQ
ncbi:glycoside hydrolase family 2 TIM barrel-domain containing protein [Niabella terrae]